MREMWVLWRLESLDKRKASLRDEMVKIFHEGINIKEETLKNGERIR